MKRFTIYVKRDVIDEWEIDLPDDATIESAMADAKAYIEDNNALDERNDAGDESPYEYVSPSSQDVEDTVIDAEIQSTGV